MPKYIYALFVLLLALCVPTVLITLTLMNTPNAASIKGCLTAEMNKVELCPKSAKYVTLGNISNELKNSILLSEDSSFYAHKGFDFHELKASFKLNLMRRSLARGGSTITQQLAKNVFLSGKKTLGRKLKEAYLAHQIEQILSKDQIFERYLNVIELDKNVYGIKSASRHYFDKSAAELNLLESAFIAYLLPNPKKYSNVYRRGSLTEYSKHRIIQICKRLRRFGRITQEQLLTAEELVGRFPWTDLTADEVARLSNGVVEFSEPFPEDAEGSWYEHIEPVLPNKIEPEEPSPQSETDSEIETQSEILTEPEAPLESNDETTDDSPFTE